MISTVLADGVRYHARTSTDEITLACELFTSTSTGRSNTVPYDLSKYGAKTHQNHLGLRHFKYTSLISCSCKMGVAKIADLLLQTNFTELHTLIIAISSYVLFALYHVSHSLLDDNTEMHVPTYQQ